MGRRPRAGRRAGGGDGIPAFGESRIRVADAVAALALFGALAAYPAAATSRLFWLVFAFAVAGSSVLLIALAGRRAALIGPALVLFGVEYAVFLLLRGDGVDSRAPFVAATLIVVAELAFHAAGRGGGRTEGKTVVRSLLLQIAVAGGAAIVGGVVLVAAGSVRSGLALEAVAVVAAAVAVGAVVAIAARGKPNAR